MSWQQIEKRLSLVVGVAAEVHNLGSEPTAHWDLFKKKKRKIQNWHVEKLI